jgi:NADPH:quinone reductase-like Zn-dependent oxidoreductase
MSGFGICGKDLEFTSSKKYFNKLEIKGVELNCISYNHNEIKDVSKIDIANEQVIIKVLAFSCNYRDISVIHNNVKNIPDNGFVPIGSEFIAEVIKIGSGVTGISIGDHVIPDQNFYGAFNSNKVSNGVSSNTASLRYSLIPSSKLLKVPSSLPIEVGASFSLGAQTAYSMIEKAKLNKKSNVLIMSATSNTSMFILSKLKSLGVNCYAVTSGQHTQKLLKEFDIKEVVQRDEFYENNLLDLAKSIGGFDVVFDPFIDINAKIGLKTTKPNGRYVTCGLYAQSNQVDYDCDQISVSEMIFLGLMNNIEIIFNCLGKTRHLKEALKDLDNEDYKIIVDSIYHVGQEKEFLERSFESNKRFGKVIFQYET